MKKKNITVGLWTSPTGLHWSHVSGVNIFLYPRSTHLDVWLRHESSGLENFYNVDIVSWSVTLPQDSLLGEQKPSQFLHDYWIGLLSFPEAKAIIEKRAIDEMEKMQKWKAQKPSKKGILTFNAGLGRCQIDFTTLHFKERDTGWLPMKITYGEDGHPTWLYEGAAEVGGKHWGSPFLGNTTCYEKALMSIYQEWCNKRGLLKQRVEETDGPFVKIFLEVPAASTRRLRVVN